MRNKIFMSSSLIEIIWRRQITHIICQRIAKGFFILNGDIYEVLISLFLRSTPFTIFSGHILIHIGRRWNVSKRVRKGQFIRYYDNFKILAWENIKKSNSRSGLEPTQSASKLGIVSTTPHRRRQLHTNLGLSTHHYIQWISTPSVLPLEGAKPKKSSGIA